MSQPGHSKAGPKAQHLFAIESGIRNRDPAAFVIAVEILVQIWPWHEMPGKDAHLILARHCARPPVSWADLLRLGDSHSPVNAGQALPGPLRGAARPKGVREIASREYMRSCILHWRVPHIGQSTRVVPNLSMGTSRANSTANPPGKARTTCARVDPMSTRVRIEGETAVFMAAPLRDTSMSSHS